MTTPTTDPVRPPQGATRVLLDPNEKTVWTANRETDCRTALTRGVKEYIEQLRMVALGGREALFKQVLQTWAEPEMPAKYPSAIVYGAEGKYDASAFTPGINAKMRVPDGRFIAQLAEYVATLTVEIWSTDPQERVNLVMLLEDAFNPTDFMFGFRLALPHYFNAKGTFEMTALAYQDTEEEAKRRYRRAVFTLEGRVPLIRLASFPLAKAEAQVDVVDSAGEFSDP